MIRVNWHRDGMNSIFSWEGSINERIIFLVDEFVAQLPAGIIIVDSIQCPDNKILGDFIKQLKVYGDIKI